MHEPFELVIVAQEETKPAGVSIAVSVSLFLHALMIVLFIRSYGAEPAAADAPVARYVELVSQAPREFVEAPGPEVAEKPLRAPFSDRNRKASIPVPTGDTPTTRPGDGREFYTPPAGSPAPQAAQAQAQPHQQARQPQQASLGSPSRSVTAAAQPAETPAAYAYREPVETSAASAMVDWRQAIRQVKPSAGSSGGVLDGGAAGGGERGTAEQGPISFETQWFDWGPYAQSMVSRIRVNWYAHMPQLIRTGIPGVVTVRFTIHRDGRLSDITILETSGHPPYDFAARKAIELSSPLNPLPADFPNPTERVTAKFFYNKPLDA